MQKPIIAPSILSADFSCLGEEVQSVISAGADWIHFDVMDNSFVPNLTFGPCVLRAIRGKTKAPIDVHLMVSSPDSLISAFADAGADWITVHAESTPHLDRSLQLIRSLGVRSGVVLNPSTPIGYLEYVLDKTDMVLLMCVNPGFGGQKFIPASLKKIAAVRGMLDAYRNEAGREIRLEVDGGVKQDNIAQIAAAGADTFVAGSAIFSGGNQQRYAEVISRMRAEIAGAVGTVV